MYYVVVMLMVQGGATWGHEAGHLRTTQPGAATVSEAAVAELAVRAVTVVALRSPGRRPQVSRPAIYTV